MRCQPCVFICAYTGPAFNSRSSNTLTRRLKTAADCKLGLFAAFLSSCVHQTLPIKPEELFPARLWLVPGNLAKKQPLRKSASPLQQPSSRNFSYRGRCKQQAQQCTCIVFCVTAIPNTVLASKVWITAISHGTKKRRFKSSNQHVHRQETTCHRLHQYQVRENT